jgi:hypothetical protein
MVQAKMGRLGYRPATITKVNEAPGFELDSYDVRFHSGQSAVVRVSAMEIMLPGGDTVIGRAKQNVLRLKKYIARAENSVVVGFTATPLVEYAGGAASGSEHRGYSARGLLDVIRGGTSGAKTDEGFVSFFMHTPRAVFPSLTEQQKESVKLKGAIFQSYCAKSGIKIRKQDGPSSAISGTKDTAKASTGSKKQRSENQLLQYCHTSMVVRTTKEFHSASRISFKTHFLSGQMDQVSPKLAAVSRNILSSSQKVRKYIVASKW